VLKKIRRTLALQGLLLSAMAWFGWKNRDAIERSVRAARAAWDEVGGEQGGPPMEEVVIAAIVVPEDGAEAPYREPDVARPGF
jgi:hypothetical protein